MANKEAIAKAPQGRVGRTPVSRRNILTVSGKEPGFVYRIVNDDGDRVQQFLNAGYEIVEDEEVTVGDTRVNNPSRQGSAVTAHVGGGKLGILMRQKQEWYDEDQAAKQAHVKATEDATREKALDGNYGDIRFERN